MKNRLSKSEQIELRTIKEVEYIIKTKCTTRECCKVFGVSKSTTHRDITKKLPKISKKLYDKVYPILQNNFEIKHIKGGNSTKNKYKVNIAA